MAYEVEFIECECSSHAVSVSRWTDDSSVYISLWGRSEMNNDSWRERVRRAWDALRGNLHIDNVVLDRDEALRFASIVVVMAADD